VNTRASPIHPGHLAVVAAIDFGWATPLPADPRHGASTVRLGPLTLRTPDRFEVRSALVKGVTGGPISGLINGLISGPLVSLFGGLPTSDVLGELLDTKDTTFDRMSSLAAPRQPAARARDRRLVRRLERRRHRTLIGARR
jgi:hypothetical protein